MKTISKSQMNYDEWVEERRKGIGGSDAAAIIGANPYSTPLSVYAEKVIGARKEETEAMRQGKDFEEYVAKRFEEETGKKVCVCYDIYVSEKYPWMRANVDRLIVGENAGLECKTTNMLNGHKFDVGEVPVTYQWQCQHYMAVTGFEKWYLAVLVFSKGFYVYEIPRNEYLISALISVEDKFWNENVLKRIPPMPTGDEADDDAMSVIFPNQDGSEIDLEDMEETFQSLEKIKNELESIKQEEKRAECEKERIEQIIRLKMENHSVGRCGEWVATLKPTQTQRIDVKALREERPEIALQYTRKDKSKIFSVNMKK